MRNKVCGVGIMTLLLFVICTNSNCSSEKDKTDLVFFKISQDIKYNLIYSKITGIENFRVNCGLRGVKFESAIQTNPIPITSSQHLCFIPGVYTRNNRLKRKKKIVEYRMEAVKGEQTHILYQKEIQAHRHGLIDEKLIVECDLTTFKGQEIAFRWSIHPADGTGAIEGFIGCPGVINKAKKPTLPNIILICSDTHRYDFSLGKGSKEYLPGFYQFVEESFVFHRAYANAPWTVPSVASVLTGMEPLYHGIGWRVKANRTIFSNSKKKSLPGKNNLMKIRKLEMIKHNKQFVTLAEELKSYNYLTACLMANGYSYLSGVLNDGFDITINLCGLRERTGDKVNAVARLLTGNYPRRCPLFLYLHYMDIHDYFSEVRNAGIDLTSPQAKEVCLDLYKKRVLQFDAYFSEMLDILKETGLYDNSIIIFYSDHGENLADCDIRFGHGADMYDQVLHVPLVIKLPGKYKTQPEHIYEPVQLIDVFPTIMQLISDGGANQRQHYRGMSLANLMLKKQETPDRYIRSAFISDGHELAAVRYGKWKYIHNLTKPGGILIHSPGEDGCDNNDCSKSNTNIATQLKRIIKNDIAHFVKYRLNADKSLFENPTREQLKMLKSLGYIQ